MNLPNKITLLRVFMIPAFLVVYMAQPFAQAQVNDWLVLVLFAAAAITDALDGYLARKLKLVTNFGKLMDPLADKLLVCSALVAFVASGALPAWAVIIMISREFYISGLRQLALEQSRVLAATGGAKFKTISQVVLIIYVMLPIYTLVFAPVVWVLIAVSIISSLWTAFDYTWKNREIFKLKGDSK